MVRDTREHRGQRERDMVINKTERQSKAGPVSRNHTVLVGRKPREESMGQEIRLWGI